MRLLYVHEPMGSLGGAEANVLSTATDQDDEEIHPAFQLLHDDGGIDQLLRRKVVALAFTTP